MSRRHIYRKHHHDLYPPTPKCCRASVDAGRMGVAQCSRKPVVWEDVEGETEQLGFCRQHSTVATKKREAKRDAQYRAERKAAEHQADRRALRESCFDAVAKLTEKQAEASVGLALWRRVRGKR